MKRADKIITKIKTVDSSKKDSKNKTIGIGNKNIL
jgi:hypothetical protein